MDMDAVLDWAEKNLTIRDKAGRVTPFRATQAQRIFLDYVAARLRKPPEVTT